MTSQDHQHADQIKRLESRHAELREEQTRLWQDCSDYGEFGDLELTAHGKRMMADVGRELDSVNQSLDAIYRI